MIEYKDNSFVNGFLERKAGGRFEGELYIEGVNLSPIEGAYFKKDEKLFLWLKRKPLLEYDIEEEKFHIRPREPRWEAYLEKKSTETVAYKGEFMFLRFRYQIIGVWDAVLGKDKQRLNFFVERKPMPEQVIINKINERYKSKINNHERRR